MAGIVIHDRRQAFGAFAAVRGVEPHHRARRVPRAAPSLRPPRDRDAAPVGAPGRVTRMEPPDDRTRLRGRHIDIATATDPRTRARPGDEAAAGPLAPIFLRADGRRIRA